MGVTVHFYGRLKSELDYQAVIAKGKAFAAHLGSEVLALDSLNKALVRVKDEKVCEYESSIRGIQFRPHFHSDPIVLEFDSDNYIQAFCKTQFAGIATHIEVIKFLRGIESHFEDLNVVDEGDFWATNDIERLEKKFEDFFAAFETAKKANPKLNGPYRLGDRIIDLMKSMEEDDIDPIAQ